MSLALALVVVPVALLAAALIPALCVQLALGFWYRPAARLWPEEAWTARFDERLSGHAQGSPG